LLAYFLFLRVSYGEFKRRLDTLFLLERAAAGVATATDDEPVSSSEAFKAAVVKMLIVSFDSVSAAVADETPVCDTSKTVVKRLIVSFESVSAAVADETPVCDTSKAVLKRLIVSFESISAAVADETPAWDASKAVLKRLIISSESVTDIFMQYLHGIG
jgi:predicted metal-dependent enzyme (double-stranded beta helix superfamily)